MYCPLGVVVFQSASREGLGDQLHSAFVCSDFVNSLAGTVLVQS